MAVLGKRNRSFPHEPPHTFLTLTLDCDLQKKHTFIVEATEMLLLFFTAISLF